MSMCVVNSAERDNIRLCQKVNAILRSDYTQGGNLDDFCKLAVETIRSQKSASNCSIITSLLDYIESWLISTSRNTHASFESVVGQLNKIESKINNQVSVEQDQIDKTTTVNFFKQTPIESPTTTAGEIPQMTNTNFYGIIQKNKRIN